MIKKIAEDVFGVTGHNPKLDIALELERIALQDEYFISRKLYPNVDFYSGLIYQAIGFKPEMFTVLFAIPRTVGWLAQWQEMIERSGAEDRSPATDLHRATLPPRRAHGRAEQERPGNNMVTFPKTSAPSRWVRPKLDVICARNNS